jgi:hypothetical protein
MPALRSRLQRPALQPGFPVEIGPEDEPRPGYSAQTFTPRASARSEVCGDCQGSGTSSDYDGSLTGRPGASVACSCSGGAW